MEKHHEGLNAKIKRLTTERIAIERELDTAYSFVNAAQGHLNILHAGTPPDGIRVAHDLWKLATLVQPHTSHHVHVSDDLGVLWVWFGGNLLSSTLYVYLTGMYRCEGVLTDEILTLIGIIREELPHVRGS